MNVLVLNAGSSTIKFQLIRTDAEAVAHDADVRLAEGVVERIGGEAIITAQSGSEPRRTTTAQLRDIRAAIDWVLQWLVSSSSPAIESLQSIEAVGHRVVHGGEHFQHSVLIDDSVLQRIEDAIDLAPLHNPANVRGIEAVQSLLGNLPQAAVFDTAFHQSLPAHAFLYAIPYGLYRRHRVRRYGFHGTSHRYVAYRYRRETGLDHESTNIITLHLGNGASACAIKHGHSIDTSMGFTPLEGLVMGTRSGDMDPAIPDFIAMKEGLSESAVQTLLNKQSGLLGISGITNDMRELLAEAAENDDRRARLAIEMFAYRVKKYVGSYLAAMGGADAIIFTGGIGENSPDVRALVLEGMQWAGVTIDASSNTAAPTGTSIRRISTAGSRMEAWVIPTNEELLIARDTMRLVAGLPLP